jgi:hypothetical protein
MAKMEPKFLIFVLITLCMYYFVGWTLRYRVLGQTGRSQPLSLAQPFGELIQLFDVLCKVKYSSVIGCKSRTVVWRSPRGYIFRFMGVFQPITALQFSWYLIPYITEFREKTA